MAIDGFVRLIYRARTHGRNSKASPLVKPRSIDIVVRRGYPQDHYLDEYIAAAGIAGDVDGYLFRTAARKTGMLTEKPLSQPDANRMVQRRAKAIGIETRIGNHTFRATGITAYLKNSGTALADLGKLSQESVGYRDSGDQ